MSDAEWEDDDDVDNPEDEEYLATLARIREQGYGDDDDDDDEAYTSPVLDLDQLQQAAAAIKDLAEREPAAFAQLQGAMSPESRVAAQALVHKAAEKAAASTSS